MSDTWHVYPVNDLIDHETDNDGCICQPRNEAITREDGSCGWLSVHHSLDGRELQEQP